MDRPESSIIINQLIGRIVRKREDAKRYAEVDTGKRELIDYVRMEYYKECRGVGVGSFERGFHISICFGRSLRV